MYLRQYHLMAKTMPMLKSYNLPGQGLLLQGLVSSPRPTQSCPPWAGLGLVHVRARVCIPLPQDRVHLLQGFHPLHWPSTDNISNGKREWVIFRSKNRSESLAANGSEFTQQDGRKKRTTKRLCVTNVTAIIYEFCRDLHLTFMFSGLLQNYLFKRKWRLLSSLLYWWVDATGWQEEEDSKTLERDKYDGAITCVFCRKFTKHCCF